MKTLTEFLKERPLHFVKTGMNILQVAKFMGLHNIRGCSCTGTIGQTHIKRDFFRKRPAEKMHCKGCDLSKQ